jgi:hypothetical protein
MADPTLREALQRGVKVRIVLYNEYNEGAIEALKQLRTKADVERLRGVSLS